MKNKICIIAALCLCYSFSFSHPKDSLKFDSLNESVSKVNESINKIEIENEHLKQKVEEKGEGMERLVFMLKLATWGVDALILLTALFGFFHFFSLNEEKKKIKKSMLEVGAKMKSFEEQFKNNLTLDEINREQKRRSDLRFENLFTFMEDYINSRKGEQKTKDSLYLKRGLIYIYDDKAEVRNKGIFILSQYGKLDDIKHLEKMISDANESEDNKKIALEAIIQIRDRYKLFSEVENERFKAISVLIQNGGSEDIPGLEKIISNAGESERNKELAKKALEAIIQIRDQFKLLSEDENERFKAISVLIQNGGSEDIPGLEKIISNAGESERNKELAKKAIEAIIQTRDRFKLLSEDENERFKKIYILLLNGGSVDIPGLEKIISNASESERNKELAKQAIEAIKLRDKK